MSVTKYELKLLRWIYRNSSRSLSSLNDRYDRETVSILFENGYICFGNVQFLSDIPDDALVSLTRLGITTVEEQEWFDWPFLIRNILLPIFIGVLSSVITNLLLSF